MNYTTSREERIIEDAKNIHQETISTVLLLVEIIERLDESLAESNKLLDGANQTINDLNIQASERE